MNIVSQSEAAEGPVFHEHRCQTLQTENWNASVTNSFLFLVAILLLVAMPGAPSSVLATSSDALVTSSDIGTHQSQICLKDTTMIPQNHKNYTITAACLI